MRCINCSNELIKGFISLHSAHMANVRFSSGEAKADLVERFFYGTIFDKENGDEIKILSSKKNERYKTAYYCKECDLVIIDNNQR